MLAPPRSARPCPACGQAAGGESMFCGGCGQQLTAPDPAASSPGESPIAPPAPAAPPAPHSSPAALAGWPVTRPSDHSLPAPTALLAVIAALIVIAFAGAAIAIILAISDGDNTASAGSAATTITVITSAP